MYTYIISISFDVFKAIKKRVFIKLFTVFLSILRCLRERFLTRGTGMKMIYIPTSIIGRERQATVRLIVTN